MSRSYGNVPNDGTCTKLGKFLTFHRACTKLLQIDIN